MRTSSKQTTVAVLRSIVGVKVQEMSEILGCSVATINSLEIGRLNLSVLMAQKIVHETGIALRWLLYGDVSAPPVTAHRKPFTRETFDITQAKKIHYDKVIPLHFATDFVNFAGRLRGILASANRAGNYFMPAYKVGKFLDALARECGDDGRGHKWAAERDAMLGDIATADSYFAAVAAVSKPGGHDVAELHKAVASKRTTARKRASR